MSIVSPAFYICWPTNPTASHEREDERADQVMAQLTVPFSGVPDILTALRDKQGIAPGVEPNMLASAEHSQGSGFAAPFLGTASR